MPTYLRQALPHLVALLVYIGLSVFVFSPIYFDNKELSQHDILMGAGANQEIEEYREQGIEPYWTNSMFSGMPSYLITARYSADLMQYIKATYQLGLSSMAGLLLAAFLSFYILLLCSGVRAWLAIPGGLAYGLSTFMLISLEAGHNSKVMAMAYAPLVIAGVITMYHKKYWWGFALTCMGVGLHLRAGHLQITYYLLLILVIFAAVYFILSLIAGGKINQLIKPSLLLIVAALVGLACNFGKIYHTATYGKYSIRGKSELQKEESESGLNREYAFSWSNGIEESLTLLIPYYYGGASAESLKANSKLGETMRKNGIPAAQTEQFLQRVATYWGDQPFTGGPIYLGAIAVFLFVLGGFFAPPTYRWWLISTAIFGLILSWGKNLAWFNYFLFDYLPGYNKFRAVSMALFIPMLVVPYLGFVGLEGFWQRLAIDKDKAIRLFWLIAGGTLGFLLIVYLFSLGFTYEGKVDAQLVQYPEWLLSGIKAQRESMLQGDLWRSFFYIVAGAGLIWYNTFTKQANYYLAAAGLVLLFAFDLLGVNTRYLQDSDYQKNVQRQYFAQNAADKAILKDEDINYRVLNLANPWNEARTSYHHSSVGGYHGAKLGRYQELIDEQLTPEIQQLISGLQQNNPDYEALNGLNMLNTKYFMAGNQAEAVIPNPEAYGNAWPVKEVLRVNNANDELSSLKSVNTREQAVINTNKFNLPDNIGAANGQITLTDYQPNQLTYEATMATGGMVVFSEIYYPEGWTATIDGQETLIYQANYVLRALQVPEGKHTINFTFTPPLLGTINIIMILGGLILVVALAMAFWKGNRQATSLGLLAE